MTFQTAIDIMHCADETERSRMIAKLAPGDAKFVLRYVLSQMHEQVQTSPHNKLEK